MNGDSPYPFTDAHSPTLPFLVAVPLSQPKLITHILREGCRSHNEDGRLSPPTFQLSCWHLRTFPLAVTLQPCSAVSIAILLLTDVEAEAPRA